MLTIINPTNGRQTDYSRQSLATEALYLAKHATDSDGKLRAWSIRVEGINVSLRVDYLTKAGDPRIVHESL